MLKKEDIKLLLIKRKKRKKNFENIKLSRNRSKLS